MTLLYQKLFSKGCFQTFDSFNQEVASVHQCHGEHIVHIRQANGKIKADGIISPYPSQEWHPLPLSIVTADCLPILILGKKGIGFLHGGHRGIQKKIHTHPKIEDLQPEFVFVGPHIQECCYEVQKDFYSRFPNSSCFSQREQKIFFNLNKQIELDLTARFPQIHFEAAPICTCCDKSFNSYRRNKTKKRNFNIFSFSR